MIRYYLPRAAMNLRRGIVGTGGSDNRATQVLWVFRASTGAQATAIQNGTTTRLVPALFPSIRT